MYLRGCFYVACHLPSPPEGAEDAGIASAEAIEHLGPHERAKACYHGDCRDSVLPRKPHSDGNLRLARELTVKNLKFAYDPSYTVASTNNLVDGDNCQSRVLRALFKLTCID